MADDGDDEGLLSVSRPASGRSSKMSLKQATSRIKQEALKTMRMSRSSSPSEDIDRQSSDPQREDSEMVDALAPEAGDDTAQPVISKARKESYDGGASETSGRVDYTSGGYASVEGDDDSDADYYGEGSDSTGSETAAHRRRRHKSKNLRKRRYTTESVTSEPTDDPGAVEKSPVVPDQAQNVHEEQKESEEEADRQAGISRRRTRGKRGKRAADEEVESQEGDDEEGEASRETIDINQTTETTEPMEQSEPSNEVSTEPTEDTQPTEPSVPLPSVPLPSVPLPSVFLPSEPSPYDYDDFVSQPTSNNLPSSLVSLRHSFGYECQRRSNLHIIDQNTVLFIAGNMVQLLDIHTLKQTYLRSTTGCGIGSIVIHPSHRYFAVAENGNFPPINIYTYPELRLHRILKNGTESTYSHITFNPTGDKLASVGSYPDYMLTVWDWENEQIILRTKAFSQEVYRVSFSPENEGQLTTSGTGHIRFWKMANTFTGLKLQGDIGKFGRTELTDIAGYVELPDGKVLSGTEWGNMLLWDGGLIKVEISKKKKSCHNDVIEEIFLHEGELITAGADGFIKVWDFETIDSADITEDNSVFEMEPMIEIKVGNDVGVKSLVRSVNPDTPNMWLAQDSNGGIWNVDISVSHTRKSPERLFSFHAGSINSIAASPLTHVAATVGSDSTVRLFDYINKQPLTQEKFSSGATSLVWAPLELDAAGSTLLAGFRDGVVRVFSVVSADGKMPSLVTSSSNLQLKLMHVFKPHSSDVTALAVDPTAEILASGSADCSVFFVSIDAAYEPIGFVKTPSPVRYIQWSPPEHGDLKLLVCCLDGSVLEIVAPKKDEFDTSKTYHLDPLQFKLFKFQTVKEKLLQGEEEERKRAEEEERRRQEEKRRRQMGSDSEAEAAQEGDEMRKEEGDKDEEVEENNEDKQEKEKFVPGKLLCGFYGEKKGSFVLSMDGSDAGYLYECSFDDVPQGSSDGSTEPRQCFKLPTINGKYEANLTTTHFVPDSKFVMFGTDDGCIRVHHLPTTSLDLTNYWTFSMHDNHTGHINQLTTSYDKKHVFSIGQDGNFFVYDFNSDLPTPQTSPQAKQQATKPYDIEPGKEIEDIDNPEHYSIEEAKQKAEHDRMLRLAEEKKMAVRRQVAKLRRQFRNVKAKNNDLPKHLMLGKDKLELDPHLREEMRVQTERRIELLRKEMEWESEKHFVALRKLEARFKDVIQFDRVVVKAMRMQREVATFKTAHPSDNFRAILDSYRKQSSRSDTDGPSDGSAHPIVKGSLATSAGGAHVHSPSITGSHTQLRGKESKKLSKVEVRKQRRLARQLEWDELMKRQPDEHYEDPADVAAIEEATRNMGDFKLKTSSDYIVPEDQRVNAEKKRIQIVLLREQMFERRRQFNIRLLAVRDKKVKLVGQIREDLKQLGELQQQLSPEKRVVLPDEPRIDPEEVPEKQLETDAEMLRKFKREYDAKMAAGQKQQGDDDGGFGGFGGFGGDQQEEANQQEQGKDASVSQTNLSIKQSSSGTTISEPSESSLIDKAETIELSPLEQQLQKANEMKIIYERDRLLAKVELSMKMFDEEVHALHHHKQNLEMALKQCDVRHVTQYEELLLLKEFEKREELLAGKVDTKLAEKTEMQGKVVACEKRVQVKLREIEKLVEKEKQLHSSFTTSLGENNKFVEFLTKVFKKKIKRVKKKEQKAEGSDSESEYESSDDDLSSSDSDSDSENELDDSVCPVGCDESLFDKTLELREKRLDIEEELVDEKKASELLKREWEGLKKKLKVIEAALKAAEADLQAFQLEKQQKINELDTVVTLYLHQIQYVVNGSLPSDLCQCLVFSNTAMSQLQCRIAELESEKLEQQKLYKTNRQTRVRLMKEKKVLESYVAELMQKANEMMELKFGRLVDLDKLEVMTVNKAAVELKEKLKELEMKNIGQLAKWQREIEALQKQLTEVLKENTRRLDTKLELMKQQRDLEDGLNARQKQMGILFTGQKGAERQERERLLRLVSLQSHEIETLKEEINILSRKGGHILPPSQAPNQPSVLSPLPPIRQQ